jgi:hypothetical protein
MDLAPELRGMIYDLLLQEPKAITIDSHKPPGLPRRPVRIGFRNQRAGDGKDKARWDAALGKWLGQTPSNFSLLRVSKVARHEAASIVYGNNTFTSFTMTNMTLFLESIGDMRSYLRSIEIPHRYQVTKAPKAFKMLGDAENLRKIDVLHSHLCEPRSTYMNTARFARDVRRLLRVLHAGRKNDKSAVQVLDLVHCRDEAGPACHHCSSGEACVRKSWGCKVSCGDLQKHYEEVLRRFRASVADELDIPFEESD